MLQKILFADEKVLRAGEQIVLRPVSLDFCGCVLETVLLNF